MSAAPQVTASAFLDIGFRPFYLGAAAFAALALPLWLAAYFGVLSIGTTPGLAGALWHVHEMLFGFAPAVIAGFLLTAVRAWTGHGTPSGLPLAGLFVLWFAGRLLMLTGPAPLAALVDLAFLPVLAAVLAVPLWRSRNRRNAFVIGILLLLAAMNACYQGALLGALDPALAGVALRLSADALILLIAVIGGRVIPAFSANAISGLRPRQNRWLETAAIGAVLLILVCDAFPAGAPLPSGVFSALLAAAALLHLARWLGWQPWRTWRNPLLLMLPLAYAWLPVHLLLRATAGGDAPFIPTAALHALFIGAMAGLMLAMMCRSALGHTGRPLRAGATEVGVFALVQAAALLRVAGPLLWPGAQPTWMLLAGAAWTLAFGWFAIAYWPVLTRPRLPG